MNFYGYSSVLISALDAEIELEKRLGLRRDQQFVVRRHTEVPRQSGRSRRADARLGQHRSLQLLTSMTSHEIKRRDLR